MSTWLDIINQAFEDIGTIQAGDTITALMSADGFKRLQQLVSSLSTEGLTVHTQKTYSFPLAAGTTAYTLGAAGTMNAGERVQKVTAWSASYAGVLTTAGRVLSFEEFGEVAQQHAGEVSAVPKAVGADTAYPLINLQVFPPPSSTPGTLKLIGWTPITQPAAVGDTISLPDGWERMLHFNLAVDLYPSYPREGGIPPELAANAQNSKASIVSQNSMGQAPQK